MVSKMTEQGSSNHKTIIKTLIRGIARGHRGIGGRGEQLPQAQSWGAQKVLLIKRFGAPLALKLSIVW